MQSYINIALLGSFLYVIYRISVSLRNQQKARILGCKDVHVQKCKLPLGLDQFQRWKKANEDGRVPEMCISIFAEEGHQTFKGNALGTDFIMTVEPKNIQALLATQFRDFELGNSRRWQFFPMLGNGIFTADGKPWEHQRSMLRPQFTREQVANLDLEEAHVQELFQLLPTDHNGWTASLDIAPMFFRLTFDSATEFFFGTSIHSQRQAAAEVAGQTQDHEWKDLARNFDAGLKHLADRTLLMEFYWLHNPRDFRESIEDVHRFADHCVQNALARVTKATPSSDTSKPKYIFLDELVKVTQDPVELRSQLLHILLAGRDTTASLLSWTFALLACHPKVFQKLRLQILESFGTSTKNITFAALKSCTYLQHVMNEVLRLYPPVPINGRRAVRDTTLPLGGGPDGKSPIFVRKGQEVGYYVCVTHRMEELWGPDANAFNPDRWASHRPGWEYLPFNGGPRICLGQQFALTEAGYVITRLLQRFDNIKCPGGSAMPRHNLKLTDSPQECVVSFHSADPTPIPSSAGA